MADRPSSGLRHIIQSQDFDKELISRLFDRATAFKKGEKGELFGKTVIGLFYAPSTRTRFSFEAAINRLGGAAMISENASEFSSSVKGESLRDTARVVSGFGDVIVLRHPSIEAPALMAQYATIPVINAGCGKIDGGQHPTQAVLDLFAICQSRGSIDGVRVAIVGDLKARVVRSLAYLLAKYQDAHIVFVSPDELRTEPDIIDYLDKHHVWYSRTRSLESVIDKVDAIYMTRVQQEHNPDISDAQSLRFQESYRLTYPLASKMRPGAIVMHPLPRNSEIDPAIDALPQARYFQQAHDSVFVRMAILEYVLGG